MRNQHDDSALSRLGFLLDQVMNTGFISYIYTVNLFVLFLTDEPADILLNALAIEFISDVDEELCRASWWDKGHRYIQAGTVELTIRATLNLQVLSDCNFFCEQFGIDREAYRRRVNPGGEEGFNYCLKDPQLAAEERYDPAWAVDVQDVLNYRMMEYATRERDEMEHNRWALEDLRGTFEPFSSLVAMAAALLGEKRFRKSNPFCRFTDYRAWSKWDAVLFLHNEDGARLPEKVMPLAALSSGAKPPEVEGDVPFFPMARRGGNKGANWVTTVYTILEVLTFSSLISTVAESLRRGERLGVLLTFADGILLWLAYVFQILFPVLIAVCLVAVPACY